MNRILSAAAMLCAALPLNAPAVAAGAPAATAEQQARTQTLLQDWHLRQTAIYDLAVAAVRTQRLEAEGVRKGALHAWEETRGRVALQRQVWAQQEAASAQARGQVRAALDAERAQWQQQARQQRQADAAAWAQARQNARTMAQQAHALEAQRRAEFLGQVPPTAGSES